MSTKKQKSGGNPPETVELEEAEEEQPLAYAEDERLNPPTLEDAVVDPEKREGEQPLKVPPSLDVPTASRGGAPGWVKIPPDLRFPRGRTAIFLRFRSEWTDTPTIGEPIEGEEGLWRQCICWPISIGDKQLALNRAKQDPNRATDEMTKQMIRAVDGHVVSWEGVPGPGNVEQWWMQMGERVRLLVMKVFTQTHMLKREELQDFFENCIAVRSAG